MTLGETPKKIIATVIVFAVMILISSTENWVKTNAFWFFPYRWVALGMVIGIGSMFNAFPGQTQEENSTRTKVMMVVGLTLFTLLFFGLGGWITTNHPGWSLTFKFIVLSLLFCGWRAIARPMEK
jgi:hypothetical protein